MVAALLRFFGHLVGDEGEVGRNSGVALHGVNLRFLIVEAAKSQKFMIEGKAPQHVWWKKCTAWKDWTGREI